MIDNNNNSVEVDLGIIKQNIKAIHAFSFKVDTAIDKMLAMSNDINNMLSENRNSSYNVGKTSVSRINNINNVNNDIQFSPKVNIEDELEDGEIISDNDDNDDNIILIIMIRVIRVIATKRVKVRLV